MSPLIDDIPILLLIQAIMCTVILIVAAFSIRKSPYPNVIVKSSQKSRLEWLKDIQLMSVMLASGAVIGMSFSILGILLQVLSPSGYDAIFTGYMGLILVFSGTLGGYIATKLLENEKYVRNTLWVYFGISVASGVLFAALIENKICGMTFAFFVGFSIIGFTPIGIKMSIDIAKNLEESIPTNVVFGSGQVFSLGFTYAFQYFYEVVGATSLWCVPIFSFIAYSIFILASQNKKETNELNKKETSELDGIFIQEEINSV